jgi:hypothetical protein
MNSESCFWANRGSWYLPRCNELCPCTLFKDLCLGVFDDILIYNNTLEEHLVHIRLVFELLVKDEWKIKLSKCTLHKEKSTIWGMSLVKKV